MADAGLQNQKLQDSFEKLVIGESDDGMNGTMTKIGTSTGTAITASSFYMGTTPTYGAHAKFIPTGNNHQRALSIESQESATPGVDPSAAPWAIMEFFSGSPGVQNGEALLSSIFRVNTIQSTAGVSTGQIMFGDAAPAGAASAISKTWGGLGSILTSTGSTDIEFRCEAAVADTASNYWMIDRLKIESNVDGNNVRFDASAVGDSLFNGISATGTMDLTGNLMANNFTRLHAGANGVIKGTQELSLQETPIIKIAAFDDSAAAEVRIDAYQTDGQSQNPVINIGTKQSTSGLTHADYDGGNASTPALSGTETITIGTPEYGVSPDGVNDYQYLNLNSKVVDIGTGWIKMSIMGASTDSASPGPVTDTVGGSEASIYFVTESAETKLKWADGADSNTPYYIDSYNESAGRVLWIPKVSAVTDPALPAASQGAQIYIQEGTGGNVGKVYLKVHYNDAATEKTFELELTGAVGDWTYDAGPGL